jgi:hypothetical protein
MLSQMMVGFEQISEAAVRLYVVTPTDDCETTKLDLEKRCGAGPLVHTR